MKKMRLYDVIIIVLIGISCNSDTGKKNGENKSESQKENTKDTISEEVEYKKQMIAEGFSIFTNIEQIQYCVPLPGSIYRHDDHADVERGQHIFIRPGDSSDYLEIKGMFRSDESIGIAEYFQNSYTVEDEEQGKIIIEKKINPNDSSFYAIGYWSNFPDRKFLELTWFGKEEIVVYYVNDFTAKRQPFWEDKLEFLSSYHPFCR